MRYCMISVEWRKIAAEPIRLSDDEEREWFVHVKSSAKGGFLNEELRDDEYNEDSVQFAGIISL